MLTDTGMRRSRVVRVVARVTALAIFLGSIRMSYAGAPPSKVAPPRDSESPPGRLPDDIAFRLDSRLGVARVTALEGVKQEELTRLFDRRASSALTASGPVARFRVDLARPSWIDAVGVFGAFDGSLSVSTATGGKLISRVVGPSGTEANRSARWSRTEAETVERVESLVIEWKPGHGGAPLRELELWGRPVAAGTGASAQDDQLPAALFSGLPPGARAFPSAQGEQAISPASVSDGARNGAGSFTVAIDRLDATASRAFLVYELQGLSHFTSTLRRINGATARGRFAVVPGSQGGLQVEEIASSWLRVGSNQIQFLPADDRATASYRVSALRVAIVPTTGRDEAGGAGWVALHDGRESTTWKVAAGAVDSSVAGQADSRSWQFVQPTQPRFLELRLPRAGSGTLLVAAATGTSSAKASIRLDGLAAGWHRVALDKLPPTDHLLLSLFGGRERAAEISEMNVNGSPLPADLAPRMTVTYPLAGECVKGKVHLRGFVEPAGARTLKVNGQVVAQDGAISAEGAFATELTETEAGGKAGKPFSVDVEASYPGGASARRSVSIGGCVSRPPMVTGDDGRPKQPVEDVGAPFGQTVTPTAPATLVFGGVTMEIPAGAVDRDVRLTIRPLPTKQVAAVDAAMTNISPQGQGYRFGPHGMMFKKPIRVTLPYDRARIPAGFSENDARTFYYDEILHRWDQVGLIGQTKGQLVAVTEHFTDFINATIAMPEHPGTQSFNPTSLKDLKTADPAAGITLIQPPEPNARGTANLTFPLEVPPGRRGLAPHLAITYDSSLDNGWLGVGWDLKASAIEVDTRFGVPRYDASDTYLLDGEALVPITKPATWPAGGQYYARRIEGRFDRIRRLGSGPSSYYWEITDKNGTKSTYGAAPCTSTGCGRLANPRTPFEIFRWHLETVDDTFGNRMKYSYRREASASNLPLNQEPWVQTYLDKIEYTSHPTLAAPYSVQFVTDPGNDFGVGGDYISNARAGFHVMTRLRLVTVQVKLGTELIRQYGLNYKKGRFGKTLLNDLAVTGLNAGVLYRHQFDYYDLGFLAEVPEPLYFATPTPWGTVKKQSGSSVVQRPEHGLSSTEGDLWGLSFSTGVGFSIGPVGISITGGGGVIRGGERVHMRVLDISGDGLPDFVDDSSGANFGRLVLPSFEPNPTDHLRFSPPVAGLQPNMLGNSIREGSNFDGNLGVGVANVRAGYSQTTTDDSHMMADMDGDGFTDVVFVENGVVKVKRNTGTGSFLAQEDWGEVANDSRSLEVPEWNTPSRTGTFPVGTLTRWRAPTEGLVSFLGPISKIASGGDGVRASIWFAHGTTMQKLWSASIAGNNTVACFPNDTQSGCFGGNALRVFASPGDDFYMLVDPINDATFDDVNWNPTFTYEANASFPNLKEPYGAPIFKFAQFDDFRLVGRPEVTWVANAKGSVRLNGNIRKQKTSDDVTMRLVKVLTNSAGQVTKQVLQQRIFAAEEEASLLSGFFVPVEVNDKLAVEFISNTPVDPLRVQLLNPIMSYSTFCRDRRNQAPICGTLDCAAGFYSCHVQGDTVMLPDSAVARPTEVVYPHPQIAQVTSPTQSFTATAAGTVHVDAQVRCTGNAVGGAIGLVQGVNRLYKKTTTLGQGTTDLVVDVPVAAGDQIFFTLLRHPEAFIGGTVCGMTATVNGQNQPINVYVTDRTFPQPQPLPQSVMSGGYHGWSFGDWDGNFFDQLTEADIKAPSSMTQQNKFMFCSPSTSPTVLPANPAQRWTCRGYDSYISPGKQKPSRHSLADGRLRSLRTAKTSNFGLSASIPIAGAGVGWGDTRTTLDLIDMNGDRYPDSVAGGGVRYNTFANGTKGFGPVNANAALGTFRDLRHRNVHASANDGGYILNQVTAGAASAGIVPNKVTLGIDYAASSLTNDLMDINGDGLPDQVRQDPSNGRVFVKLNLGYRMGSELEWEGPQWGLGYADIGFLGALASVPGFGGDVSPESLSLQDTVSNSAGLSGVVVSGADTLSTIRTSVQMFDINGDGLPDQVMKRANEPTGGLRVKINQGTNFAPVELWPFPADWLGININRIDSWSYPQTFLITTNPNSLTFQRQEGWQANVGFEVCFFICFGFSAFTSSNGGSATTEFEDLDGDGAPEQVMKVNGNDTVLMKRNLTKKANLLKKVTRPLGASFTIDYTQKGAVVTTAAAGSVLTREAATVDMVGTRWVMSKVTLEDNRSNKYVTSIDYDLLPANPNFDPKLPSGFYDRKEREDLGFSHVKIFRGEPSANPNIIINGDSSSVHRFYLNHNYYTHGLMAEEYETNSQGWVMTGTRIKYDDPSGQPARTGKFFPKELERSTLFFEGVTAVNVGHMFTPGFDAPPKFKRETRLFDAEGNLTNMTDFGDEQTATDDIQYDVGYFRNDTAGIAKANSVAAHPVGSGTNLRQRTATYDTKGALLTLTNVVSGGKVPATGATYSGALSKWTFGQDPFGNVKTVLDPNNYLLTYGYDAQTQSHITSTVDSFGYTSSSVPELHFGKVASVTDVNGNVTAYSYDGWGRLSTIIGPSDLQPTATVRFTYSQQVNAAPLPAWASTAHRDVQATGDPIETIVFADGMGRIIQTKKDLARDPGGTGTTEVGRSISGQVLFDSRGRVKSQGQPAFELASVPATTFAIVPMVNPTLFSYDTLGRTTGVTLPDFSITGTSYRIIGPPIANPDNLSTGGKWLVIEMFDAIANTDSHDDPHLGYKLIFSDSRGNRVGVKEWNTIGTATTLTPLETRYQYNAIDELVKVTDAAGKITTAEYDTLGQMVALTSPDSGRTESRFDLNGNLGAKETAVLRAQSKLIKYVYDFNRLRVIDYPTMPDVTYSYGTPTERGDSNANRAGRIKQVVYEGGNEIRSYDRLGNVIEEQTTLANMGASSPANVTFKMKYTFDSFGRMQTMTFPNWLNNDLTFVAGEGEKVTYVYDRGGNLDRITGQHQTANPQQSSHPMSFPYLNHIGYDEFEQRTVLTSGNGIVNKFFYDPKTRRLTDINADSRGPQEVAEQRPATPFHRLHYSYDRVGNVTGQQNRVSVRPWRNASVFIGPMDVTFTYDNLYQLKSSSGKYRGRVNEGYQWSTSFRYDQIGNMTRKAQSLDRMVWDNQALTPTEDPAAALLQLNSWRFDHNESAATHTLDYAYTGTRPHATNSVNETLPGTGTPFPRAVTYDADGNNTGNTFRGTTRTQLWDEEDRLKEVQIGSTRIAKFRYDDSGERTKKQNTSNSDTWYPNQFYCVLTGGRPTKHIYAGETRIVSKTDPIYMQTPVLHHYHPDHLGTTSYVSDETQRLVQHERYFAFGELWRGLGPQEETDLPRPGDRKEWTFTGKEYDTETGLYYYGARYYDPRLAVWQSPDPILASYMRGEINGGVFAPRNLGLYSYSWNSPVVMRDPNGAAPTAAQIEAFQRGTLDVGHEMAAGRLTVGNAGELIHAGGVQGIGGVGDIKDTSGFVPTMAKLVLKVFGATGVIADFLGDVAGGLGLGGSTSSSSTSTGSGGPVATPGGPSGEGTVSAGGGPDFLVTPRGEAITIPSGASGPTPTSSPGDQYIGGSGGPGLDPRVTGVRIMEGNANQGQRAVYMNRTGQTVNPATGRTVPKNDPSAHQYLKPFKSR